MAWSSWQRIGDGFATGDRKPRHKISDSRDVKSDKSQQPQGRVPVPNEIQQVNKTKWNRNDFLSSFSVSLNKDDSQKADISWSDSSSEEDIEKGKGKAHHEIEKNRKRPVSKKAQTSYSKCKKSAVEFNQSHRSKFITKQLIDFQNEAHSSVITNTTGRGISNLLTIHSAEPLNLDNKLKVNTSINECNKWFDDSLPNKRNGDLNQQTLSQTVQNAISNKASSQAKVAIGKWNVSSGFDGFDHCKVLKPSSKFKNFHQEGHLSSSKNDEDVYIADSASSSECDGDNQDGGEKTIEESDDDDIPSDESYESNQSQIYQKISTSPSLTQEKRSQQIGSVTSSVGTSPSSQRVGASDWAVKFQQEVSPDSKDEEGNKEISKHDSTKKKQKYSSKSLVGQLSRLINREKSAMRFWQHSSSNGPWNADGDHKSVTLEVMSMVKWFSLYKAQCRIINDKDSLLRSAKNCQLMLVRSHADQMGIKSGTTIELFPPWKQMDEGENITILCANQVRVVSPITESKTDDKPQVTRLPTSKDSCSSGNVIPGEETVEMSFKWICPCKKNPSIQSNNCPAYHSDHYIKYFSQIALHDKTPSSLHPSHLHLHSVQSSTPPFLSKIQRTLLQSLQDKRTGGDEVDCMPPFTATVLRVFRHCVTLQNSICLSVLLEDASGTMALIQYEDVDKTCQDALWLKLFNTIGSECICHGLTLITRRNKEKDPSLFQVISHTWRRCKLQAVDSQDESQTSQVTQKIPSFCYILQCVEDAKNCLQVLETGKREELDLISLEQLKDRSFHERFSCIALVMDVQDSSQTSSDKSQSLFVYNPSLNREVKTFTTFIPLTLDKLCVGLERNKERKGRLVLLQDVVWNGDTIHADEYSSLLSQLRWSCLGLDHLRDNDLVRAISSGVINPPRLDNSTQSQSIVKVSGYIIQINEDKCYSWEGCWQCGTELVATDVEGHSHCPSCHKEVSHPETRMSMEVNILEDVCKDHIVSVDLSQKTINLLLPEEVPDEGYDMDLVLGKSISVFACVVGKTNDAIRLYQVDL